MTTTSSKPNALFWVIGIIALLWNGMGVNQYLQQAYETESFKKMYTEEQLEILGQLPAWYNAVFALAVFISFLGSVFFLLRKSKAVVLLQLGLIAVIIQTVYNLFLNPGKEHYGGFEYSMLITISLFSVFVFWYSKKCKEDGLLN